MHAAPRRRWWERAAALWLAAWFLVAGIDLPVLHTCPMHGGHGVAAGAHATAMAAAVADRPAHDGRGAHRPAPAGGGGPCSCLGACCVAMGALPPAPPALAARPTVRARVPVPGRPAYEYVAAWADFVLPFSTAPPERVTA